MIFLMMVAAAGLAAVVALAVLQSRWLLDSVAQAAVELLSRVVLLPSGGRGALRRRVARWAASAVLLMPSGAKTFPRSIVFRTAPETALRIVPVNDPALLAHDLARTIAALARREKVSVPPEAKVYVILDPVMQTGWVSAHALTAETEYDACAPVLPEGLTTDVVARPTTPLVTERVSRRGGDTTSGTSGVGMLTQPMHSIELSNDDGPAVLVGRSNILGRDGACALKVNDVRVSREHARVFLDRGRYLIEDLGSANGSTLNGRRLTAALPAELSKGDVVNLGRSDLSWRVSAINVHGGRGE